MHDCRTIAERLYPYLDRELSASELDEIRRHLDHCPPCARYFNFEEGILRFVGDACRQEAAPESLRSKIAALRNADRASTHG